MSINSAIKKGINYLSQSQLKNGGWLNQSSPYSTNFTTNTKKHHTNFIPATILQSLANLQIKNSHLQKKINKINQGTANFLLNQKSIDWTWNYWIKTNQSQHSLPDDLDDTACVLAALWSFQPELITTQAMSKITQILIALETKTGGPYKTWLVEPAAAKHWQDVDLAVNNNLAYFLSLQDIYLPNLSQLTEKAIANKNFNSQYYPYPHPVIYFISRWYQGQKRPQLIELIKQLLSNNSDTTLNTALLINAWINLNQTNSTQLQIKISQLLKQQQADGSWPASAFCFDPTTKKQRYYAGAKSLTTAVVIQALNKYQQGEGGELRNKRGQPGLWQSQRRCPGVQLEITPTNEPIFQINSTTQTRKNILISVNKNLSRLPTPLNDLAITHLQKIKKIDQHHHIALFSYHFVKSLGKSTVTHQKIIITLGEANVLGWLAYLTYDDILDSHVSPSLLSLANIALREVTIIYTRLAKNNHQVLLTFKELMSIVDTANFTETTQFRTPVKNKVISLSLPLPAYDHIMMIAEKSIAHATGPLAILSHFGYKPEDKIWQEWLSFIYHYLTAKQLNDDIHDWEQDLAAGHLSPVVTRLLQTIITNKNKKNIKLKLNSALWLKLREQFWNYVLPDLITTLEKELQLAHQALIENPAIVKPQFWQNLLQELENSTQDIANDRQQALEFLKYYQGTNP